MDPFTIAYLVIVALVAGYSYYQSRKAMKEANKRNSASQLDGSIADEGASFSDISGSPHMYTVITWIGNKGSHAIKSKGGKK